MGRWMILAAWVFCACGGAVGPDEDVLAADPGPADPGSSDVMATDASDGGRDDGGPDFGGSDDGSPADVATADDGPPPIDEHCKAVAVSRSNLLVVDGTSRLFWLHGPAAATGPGGNWPVVFLWHGFVGVAFEEDKKDDYAFTFSNLLAPEVGGEESGWPFLLVTPMADGEAVLDWNILDVYDGDTNPDVRLFEEVLRCLDARFGIDPDRIHSIGFSAGAIMTDLLGVTRGDRLASTITWSGGYIANEANATGDFDVVWPEPGPSSGWTQVVVRGGSGDIWVSPFVTIDFDDWTRNDVSWLNDRGHDVIECAHAKGHQQPVWWDVDYVIDFFQAHPRGTVSTPFANGLPASFPDGCVVHPKTQ